MARFFRRKTVIIVTALILAASAPTGATFAWLSSGGSSDRPGLGSRKPGLERLASKMERGAVISPKTLSPTVRLAAVGDVCPPGFFRFSDDHAGEMTIPAGEEYDGLILEDYLRTIQLDLESGMEYDAGVSEISPESRVRDEVFFSGWLAGFLNGGGDFASYINSDGEELANGAIPGDILFSVKSFRNDSTLPVFVRVEANDAVSGGGNGDLVFGVALAVGDGSEKPDFVPLTRVGDYYYYLESILPDADATYITVCYAAYVRGVAGIQAEDGASAVMWELGGKNVDLIQGARKSDGSGWAAPWLDTDDLSGAAGR